FTLICARLGDGDLAIPLIERLRRTPHGLGLQDLRFSPDWDPLRDDPRFQKILVHEKALSNPYMICMKMKIVDRAEKKAVSARNGTKTIRKWPVLLLLLLLPVTFGLSGCEDEYYAGARPGYGPYYGGAYGPGYGPG